MVQLKRFFQTTAKWSMTFNLPVLLTLVLFAESLLRLFGSDFVPGTAGLVILAFGAFVRTSAGPCPSMIDMTGHSKLNSVNSVFFLAVTLGLDLLFIPPLGVVGAAIAASLAVTLLHVLHLLEVYYLFRMLPYNLSFLKPITAGLVAAGVTYLIKQPLVDVSLIWQLAVGVPVIWGVYALVVVLLGFSEEDRLVIDRLSTRLGLKGLVSDYLIR
jgi:O-antigen/teichoic acid export membrane protein